MKSAQGRGEHVHYIHTAANFAIEFGEALLPWEFAVLPDEA